MSKIGNNIIKKPQLVVYVITYVISAIAIYILPYWLFNLHSIPIIIFYSIFYTLFSIVFGMYLHILFSIPQKLPKRFDEIKNHISAKETITQHEFSKELNAFLLDFFNFSFFDVQYAVVKTNGSDLVFSSPEVEQCTDWKTIEEASENSQNHQKNLKVLIQDNKLFINTFPVYFREQYLGFFSVLTTQKLSPYKIEVLKNLENDYIDDQMIRVIPDEYLK